MRTPEMPAGGACKSGNPKTHYSPCGGRSAEPGVWGRLGEPKFRFRSGELNWVNFAAEPNFPPTLSSRLKPSFSSASQPLSLSPATPFIPFVSCSELVQESNEDRTRRYERRTYTYTHIHYICTLCLAPIHPRNPRPKPNAPNSLNRLST